MLGNLHIHVCCRYLQISAIDTEPWSQALEPFRWVSGNGVTRVTSSGRRIAMVEQQGFKLFQTSTIPVYFCILLQCILYTSVYLHLYLSNISESSNGLLWTMTWNLQWTSSKLDLCQVRDFWRLQRGAVLGFFRWHLMARYELAYQFKNGVIIPGELMQP